MDVIINNAPPSVTPQVQQYAPISQTPISQTPQGYGPGYSQSQGREFHGGPGFLLPLLLVGGLLFLRGRGKRRRQMMRRYQMQNQNGQMPGGQMGGTQMGAQPMPGYPAPTGPFSSDAPGDFFDDIRQNFRRGRQQFFNDKSLDIARERYARGEISAEEYQTLLKTLTGQPGDNPNGGTQTPPPTIV